MNAQIFSSDGTLLEEWSDATRTHTDLTRLARTTPPACGCQAGAADHHPSLTPDGGAMPYRRYSRANPRRYITHARLVIAGHPEGPAVLCLRPAKPLT